MGRIARALTFSRRSLENPAAPWNASTIYGDDWNPGTSESGAAVNLTTATRLSAVWRAIGVLTDGIAALPLFVMERDKAKGRRKAVEHPLYNLLHLEPNSRHTPAPSGVSCRPRPSPRATPMRRSGGTARGGSGSSGRSSPAPSSRNSAPTAAWSTT